MTDASQNNRSRAAMQAERQKHEASLQARRAKNNETIGALKRENDKIKSEISLLTVPGAGSTIAKLEEQDRLAQMKLEIESLERRIGHEKNLGNDFDKSIQIVRAETLNIRKSLKGNNNTGDRVQAVDKQIRLLENRLDQALVDFNKALSVNRNLRQKIDNLRGERRVFKEIYDKLEAALHGRKRAMALLIERSNEDYELSDKAQQDLVNLEAVVEEDRKRYAEESRKLEDLMTRYKNAREQQQHQLIQEKARIAAEQAKKRAAKSLKGNRRMLMQMTGGAGHGSTAGSGSGGLLLSENGNANGGANSPASLGGTVNSSTNGGNNNTRGGRNGGGVSPNSDSGAVMEDDFNQLQDIIEKLKDATGVQDLDVLYQTFVQAEESNFSTFNFVNELNTEKEQLESEISKLREELASRRSESERHASLKNLETELARTEQSNEATQKRTESLKSLLGETRVIAERVFNKIGCSQEEATELLGTPNCTELNMIKFFGMIENRANAILFAYQTSSQNELRRKIIQKDEDARKKRGGTDGGKRDGAGGDDGVGEDGTATSVPSEGQQLSSAGGSPTERAKFIGLGPSNPSGTVLFDFPRDQLPSCNPGADSSYHHHHHHGEGGDKQQLEENIPLDPAKIRQEAAEKLERRHQEERAGRRRRPRRTQQ